MDPRHERRIKIVQYLYARLYTASGLDIRTPFDDIQEIREAGMQIEKKAALIDSHITSHAPKYPIDKIARIDLCILRLALYEILFQQTEPEKVIINEAVDLAKELGNDRSYAFVNAVLGACVKIKSKTDEHQTS